MSSLMHIVLIEMYVQCTMNAHELYIRSPDECTFNAHCNVHCLFATVHLKHWLMYIWCALGRVFYMYFWMHFSHYNVIDAMYFRCGQNFLTMYMLKNIEMSSLMHIVLIEMYVECTMNTHELYIWLPDECTLNAHCNVHCLFATAHLKHWLMYIWCALGSGFYMYFWMHFSHYNVIDAVYISCTNDLLTTYTITYIRMSYWMHITMYI